MSDTVDELAKKLLEYMRLDMSVEKADAIIGMGALDNRIAERSARLFLDGYGDYIIFTGGLGKVTKETHTETEAERFETVALKMGAPKDKIFLEKEASNSGENIIFARKLLKEKGISPKSILIVTKPYMERRIWATFKKQWPDSNAEVFVTSPQITYEEHFNNDIPKDLFINVMVGDLQRIKEYPKFGYQIKQNIPDDVWQAYNELVKAGYTQFLMK